jgi:hypothetical protein
VKRVNLRLEIPSVFVSGWRVLRAMAIEVALLALPPGWEIPPPWVPLKPKRVARAFEVCFSIKVRAGET